ncbi:MAG TPA: hypothetical protein VEN29_19795 [Casimicrobiaceae bacterium]|nr:hypothetical protein [Casimicrobiaceae bacterium]
MNPAAPRWHAALWWGIPVAALLLLLALETDWGRHVHRLPGAPPSVEPKSISTALLPEYQVEGGLAGHAETVNRTLFNPTRRPAPTVAGDGGRRQMQRGQFMLTGTAVAGDRNIAFLKEIAGGKARSVRQGEQINGLLVTEVRPDRVKLTLGDEFEELVLKVAPGPKTTTQPPQVPPAATPPPGVAGAPVPAPAAAPAPVPAAEAAPVEQRRRAAAAAAAAAAAGNSPAPSPAPAGSAPPSETPASPAAPASPEALPASADPAWNEVYERMRQRNPNYPK